jgi:S-adenosylmethionine:tRNA ribosyltransferase-isomerase
LKGPHLKDYNYELPEDRIAMHPVAERDLAKMLVYGADKNIIHSTFKDLPDYLPSDTLLVINDTKVVHARLLFQRDTGAQIEVFCLHPLAPYTDMALAMQVTGKTTWECLAGNQKRWKIGETIQMPFGRDNILKATLLRKMGKEVIVEFIWNELPWKQVLEEAGKMPLPPYIHRIADAKDETDYQTVFAKQDGAVAAPTAGLHFTNELIKKLDEKGIQSEKITLHVSSGTFQPVAHENVIEHPMHREQVIFDRKIVETLSRKENYIVAVGTTSLRALESLYWFGNQLQIEPAPLHFFVGKLLPYQDNEALGLKASMQNILKWMDSNKTDSLMGETEIFIFPGYDFKVCDGLITNFHLPQSTLLMLIAAFIGDKWKDIYQNALQNNYRFLSYGDGMLLLNAPKK